jgi:hypothetical protein
LNEPEHHKEVHISGIHNDVFGICLLDSGNIVGKNINTLRIANMNDGILTFEDTDFSSITRTAKQYVFFLGFSSIGRASIQSILIYLLVESRRYWYAASLVFTVLAGSGRNFVLNKKWTLKGRACGQC